LPLVNRIAPLVIGIPIAAITVVAVVWRVVSRRIVIITVLSVFPS
jgi:hypothetical protein